MAFKCETIETVHGTVCRHCRLWPDLCTCDPDHPFNLIFTGWRGKAKQDRESPVNQ